MPDKSHELLDRLGLEQGKRTWGDAAYEAGQKVNIGLIVDDLRDGARIIRKHRWDSRLCPSVESKKEDAEAYQNWREGFKLG